MEDLARDVRPFEESPRTCDLFRIHDHIAETIARALTLLRSREAWERVRPCSKPSLTTPRPGSTDGMPAAH
jgi:hypothetical protein